MQAGVYDTFASRLAEAVAALKQGPGAAEGVTIGPLIDERAVAKAEAHANPNPNPSPNPTPNPSPSPNPNPNSN